MYSSASPFTCYEVESDVDDENEIRDQIEDNHVRRLEATEISHADWDHDEIDNGHDNDNEFPVHPTI